MVHWGLTIVCVQLCADRIDWLKHSFHYSLYTDSPPYSGHTVVLLPTPGWICMVARGGLWWHNSSPLFIRCLITHTTPHHTKPYRRQHIHLYKWRGYYRVVVMNASLLAAPLSLILPTTDSTQVSNRNYTHCTYFTCTPTYSTTAVRGV